MCKAADLDVSVNKVPVHAMRPTSSSVSISSILEVIASCLQSLLEHHVLEGGVTEVYSQVHFVVKDPACVQAIV